MVVFSGEINQIIQNGIIKKRDRQLCIILVAFNIICLFSTLIIWLCTKDFDSEVLKILVLSGLSILITLIIFISSNHYKCLFKWNYYIMIEEGTITVINIHQNNFKNVKPISKIKKVIDYGDYYILNSNKWDISNGIVCQKDLIIKGSISEFEQMFNGKIVCKYKKINNIS